jgi:glyceraldehyde 3-phosphate dehydrogenase
MKTVKLGINGFGRIGRQAFKVALEKEHVEIVAINDLTSPQVLASLLKYDSNYGVYQRAVGFDESNLIVNGKKIKVIAEKDPAALPWGKLGVDVVIESTGRFTDYDKASAHIKAGAKRVIISAPAKDSQTKTFVMSVNNGDYKAEPVVSNASCTTNCITPVAQVLEDVFGIKKVMMTTIHSYTAEQNLVDPVQLHRILCRPQLEQLLPQPKLSLLLKDCSMDFLFACQLRLARYPTLVFY